MVALLRSACVRHANRSAGPGTCRDFSLGRGDHVRPVPFVLARVRIPGATKAAAARQPTSRSRSRLGSRATGTTGPRAMAPARDTRPSLWTHHVCSTATDRRCLPRLAAWVGGAFTTRGGGVRVAGLLDPSGLRADMWGHDTTRGDRADRKSHRARSPDHLPGGR